MWFEFDLRYLLVMYAVGFIVLWLLFRPKENTGDVVENVVMPDTTRTHWLVVRLDPAQLANPNIDLRWDFIKAVEQQSEQIDMFEDGFGYARHSNAMLIFFATSEPEKALAAIVQVLEQENIRDNRLADGAVVGIAPYEVGDDVSLFDVAYPPDLVGNKVED